MNDDSALCGSEETTLNQVYETFEGIKTLHEKLNHSFFPVSYVIHLNRESHITPRNETDQVFFFGVYTMLIYPN
ncbi:hypothetical protein CEF21_20635 [Bacillus sp. FJAT-42376]|nr:hypothetical protein CEF21_20635 [Bacillus sp. FJAT-42376]